MYLCIWPASGATFAFVPIEEAVCFQMVDEVVGIHVRALGDVETYKAGEPRGVRRHNLSCLTNAGPAAKPPAEVRTSVRKVRTVTLGNV